MAPDLEEDMALPIGIARKSSLPGRPGAELACFADVVGCHASESLLRLSQCLSARLRGRSLFVGGLASLLKNKRSADVIERRSCQQAADSTETLVEFASPVGSVAAQRDPRSRVACGFSLPLRIRAWHGHQAWRLQPSACWRDEGRVSCITASVLPSMLN